MNSTYISLSSLAMDLKRVALGYYHGSDSTAERFFQEALKRKNEISGEFVAPYVFKLLNKLDQLNSTVDKMRVAEDALMYSTLFQNAALKQKDK